METNNDQNHTHEWDGKTTVYWNYDEAMEGVKYLYDTTGVQDRKIRKCSVCGELNPDDLWEIESHPWFKGWAV